MTHNIQILTPLLWVLITQHELTQLNTMRHTTRVLIDLLCQEINSHISMLNDSILWDTQLKTHTFASFETTLRFKWVPSTQHSLTLYIQLINPLHHLKWILQSRLWVSISLHSLTQRYDRYMYNVWDTQLKNSPNLFTPLKYRLRVPISQRSLT